MLAVVQYEQRTAPPDPTRQRVHHGHAFLGSDPDGVGYGIGNAVGVFIHQVGKGREPRAVGERRRREGGRMQRKPRLSDPPRPQQGDHSFSAKQCAHLPALSSSPVEAGGLTGKPGAGWRAQHRLRRGHPADHEGENVGRHLPFEGFEGG
jgi:hypothetical protein